MKTFAKILLSAVLATLSWTPFSISAQETDAVSCRLKLVSGPVRTEGSDAKYIFSAGKYNDDPSYYCIWRIDNERTENSPCAIKEKDYSSADIQAGREVTVGVFVYNKATDKQVCGDTQTFKVGEKLQIIERKLENQYPILPDNARITTGTTPSGLIRYVFILALSAIGLVALFGLILSGASWATGNQDRAKKILGNVGAGIVFLLGIYVVINFIDPELLVLKDPILPQVNIQIDERLKNILKKCNELGIRATCSVYGDDTKFCQADYCGVFDGPCVRDATGCASVKKACNSGSITKCEDYQTTTDLFGSKNALIRRNACEINACNVNGDCEAYTGATLSADYFECLSVAQAKQRRADDEAAAASRCQGLTINKCGDYRDPVQCNSNACGGAQDAPCRYGSDRCAPLSEFSNTFICQSLPGTATCKDYTDLIKPGVGQEDYCVYDLCGVSKEGRCSWTFTTNGYGVCAEKS